MSGLRDLLAGVAAEHSLGYSPATSAWLCACGWVNVHADDLDALVVHAAHLADVQAAAVDGWLSGLRETVADVGGVGYHCSHTGPVVNDGCEDCRNLADAALAAIRERIGAGQ